jgi:hypothetical protein
MSDAAAENDPAERERMQDALRKGAEGLNEMFNEMLRQEACAALDLDSRFR